MTKIAVHNATAHKLVASAELARLLAVWQAQGGQIVQLPAEPCNGRYRIRRSAWGRKAKGYIWA